MTYTKISIYVILCQIKDGREYVWTPYKVSDVVKILLLFVAMPMYNIKKIELRNLRKVRKDFNLDTELLFFNHNGFNLETYEDLPEYELNVVKRYVEITRHLHEIHQLYQMFIFNIDALLNTYELKGSGDILRRGEPARLETDYIAINAYTNNIISSGRTLVEAMECYVKVVYPEDDPVQGEYSNYYHSVYDSSFSYRLLIHLRNYAQHGHLPVSLEETGYCFNLYHILHKPHFNHKKNMETQMINIIQEIKDTYQDTPTLSLTYTLVEFIAQLLSIYEKFWFSIGDELVKGDLQFRQITHDYPQNVVRNTSGKPEYFLYEIKDGNADLAYLKEDATQMLCEYYGEAISSYLKYKNSWED